MITIGGVAIGDGLPCRVVAELSNNHNGDRDRLGRLIDAAQAAGADLVKFQCYTPEELVALRGDGPAPAPWGLRGWSMRDLYTKAQTPLDWFPKIAAHCQRVGMPWFSSVFGPDSLACLEAVGCPAYKVARLDNQQEDLQDLIAQSPGEKPVLVSAEWGEDVLGDLVLYCPKGYPPDPQTVRLPPHFGDHETFQGFSYHGLDPDLPRVAAERGCHLIEMHMQLAEEPGELEGDFSLTQYQFHVMALAVHQVSR